MTVISVGQLGFNVNVNQSFVAGWHALLQNMNLATVQVADILAKAYTAGAFTTLLAANTTYTAACAASYALTNSYFQSNIDNFSNEKTARTLIAANVSIQLTALSTYIKAWKTVINNASNTNGDIQTFYNFVLEDQKHFLLALKSVLDAIAQSYPDFKNDTDAMYKFTGTNLATVAGTDIPAAVGKLSLLVQKMTVAYTELETAVNVCLIRNMLPLPGQAQVANAITAMTDASKDDGDIVSFQTAISLVFTDLAADVAAAGAAAPAPAPALPPPPADPTA